MTKKNILNMTNIEAKNFFLQASSYSTIDLPPYLNFEKILYNIAKNIGNKKISDITIDKKNKPNNFDSVNYKLLTNKNGKFSWRKFQLINPLIYVTFVNEITEKNNWNEIINRFKNFRKNKRINCVSVPVLTKEKVRNTKKITLLNWWEEIEQKSLSMGIEYSYIIQTDITNCYPSLYTHSIAWALHGKTIAKSNKTNQNFLGNKIDAYIQSMQYGQTNGIPQGSILMDFIAEIVLGYIDEQLSIVLDKLKIRKKDYYILRYRDDYKIFINDRIIGDNIIKELSYILSEFGWMLNANKTTFSENVIEKSLKQDKFHLLNNNLIFNEKLKESNIEKVLLAIYKFSLDFINSGQLVKMLTNFYSDMLKIKKIRKLYISPILSIVLDIAYRNPKAQPICCALISKILSLIRNKKEKIKIFKSIKAKLNNVANNGYCEIWLQRISLSLDKNILYNENICKLLNSKSRIQLWNDLWCKNNFKKLLNSKKIISRKELKKIKPIINISEVNKFIHES